MKRPRRQNVGPQRREATARVPVDVARRVRDGHPWIFNDALRGRTLSTPPGKVFDVVDHEGKFVARAVCDPGQNLILRVFSTKQGQALDQAYINQTIRSCFRLRQRMLDLSSLSCYRLINGDSEGIPAVTADVYGPYVVLYFYSSIAKTIQPWLVSALASLNQFQGIYLQSRFQSLGSTGKPRSGAELLWGEPAPLEVVVTEAQKQFQAKFLVDVTSPSSPGIFPDMRLGRGLVADLSEGRDILNCYSYTGGFSVITAMSGAKSVVSVDTSAKAHSRARRNFNENHLNPDEDQFEFVTGDTFATLTRFAERKRTFDLIILDPPTFSSGPGKAFTAVKDYVELIDEALGVLRSGGLIFAATNAIKISENNLEQAIGRGAYKHNRQSIILFRLGQPPDYPVRPGFSEGAYLKFIVAKIS